MDAPSSPAEQSDPQNLSIVAIGASAGGLEALREFFRAVVPDDRMAFVVVTHLPSEHVSHLPELLQRAGPLPACEAQGGARLAGGQIYVMPPGRWMTVHGGLLAFEDKPVDTRAAHHPIDHFMTALADDAGVQSIGIVLSGTDHDGTAGLKAIKAAGGWTLAQAPASAQYPSMPQSAIAAGAADEVMPPAAMAAALLAYLKHQPQDIAVVTAADGGNPAEISERLNEVLALVAARTGNDFHWYRPGMLRRRLRRRMVQRRCEHLNDYMQVLHDSPDETAALAREFLIGVTDFFRDAEAWDELADTVLPALLADRRPDDPPLRVWTPGCSSGEESYSIAMLLIEALEQHAPDAAVQVFATDIDLEALEVARHGVYPASIATTVSPHRLARFFDRRGDTFVVRKSLRERVMFAPQNLVRDTPFSRLDLVLCRNLLMYFEQALQDRVVQLFHFALRPGGFLWLGKAESLSGHRTLFESVSRPTRLYRRLAGRAQLPRGFTGPRAGPSESLSRTADRTRPAADVVRAHLSGRDVSAAVLVDRDGRALFFQGDTGRFLAPQGEATQELLRLVRGELRSVTRALLRQLLANGLATSRRITLSDGAKAQHVVIHADAVCGPESRGAFVVTFNVVEPAPSSDAPVEARADAREGELEESRRELTAALEDAERSNEDLRLATEEARSLNEELQSSNEELESSKEELQSLNEELATVNAELEEKVVEVARQADDLTNLLESTQLPAVLLDRELRIRRFTPAAVNLFGLRTGDEGRLFSDINSRLESAGFAEAARRAVEQRETSDAEVLGPEGKAYLRRVQPFLTGASEVDGAVATFIDVTAMRDAARQMRQLAAVLEGANDAVISLDLEGRIQSWNKGAAQTYGYSAAQARDLSLFELIPPEFHDETRRMMERARTEGGAGPADVPRRARDGRVVSASVLMSALYDEHGAVSALLSTERDITERRRIESEIRFRRLADDIPALLRVEDRQGVAQFVNRACTEFTGAPRDALLGRGWLEFVELKDRERYLKEHAAAQAARVRLETDIRLIRHDGTTRWMRSISVPHVDVDGEYAGNVALMLDIEDRKAAEDDLREADRRKDEFLAMLAHELRNPLAPIHSASQLLARPDVPPRTTAWAVGVIDRQIQAMSKMLDSLLDVARIARGKAALELAPVELRVVLARAQETSQVLIDSRRQTLTVVLPEADIVVECDLVRLTQVFANLLNNASKYTDEGGAIDITVESSDRDVVVHVRDNGSGIAADMLPRVFDLFSQADRTLDRAKGGLGLGLTLVRQLVELHHGEVNAASPGLGQGSTFSVRLPLLPQASRPAAPASTAQAAEGAGPESRRVLVVDDNVDAAETLAVMLQLHGHTVSVAHDGARALAMAEEHPPDVVILDIGLPGIDGYQVARTLRGRAATARVTIAALTGYGQAEDAARALSAGCDLHFVKPVNMQTLVTLVGKAAARRS
jgi:two-component system CheB/CheR fusion protein